MFLKNDDDDFLKKSEGIPKRKIEITVEKKTLQKFLWDP